MSLPLQMSVISRCGALHGRADRQMAAAAGRGARSADSFPEAAKYPNPVHAPRDYGLYMGKVLIIQSASFV